MVTHGASLPGSKADGAAVLRDLSLALRADEQAVRSFHLSMADKIVRIEEICKLVLSQ